MDSITVQNMDSITVQNMDSITIQGMERLVYDTERLDVMLELLSETVKSKLSNKLNIHMENNSKSENIRTESTEYKMIRIRSRIYKLVEKYRDLTYLENGDIDKKYFDKKHFRKILKKYPEEIMNILNNKDWQHGFNKGILACAELLLPYAYLKSDLIDECTGDMLWNVDLETMIKTAEDTFPNSYCIPAPTMPGTNYK